MHWIEIALRLAAATLIGGALGLNRDLHGKPTGLRTLGLVGLGSAMVVVAVMNTGPAGTTDFNAASRIVQGILTGIGFLGAGVIVRGVGTARVHGLTTAACTWLTACLGTVCGFAQPPVIVIALVLTLAILIFGGPIERWFHSRLPPGGDNPSES
ncbi:MAG TPA: MgtC/SapB family protein [Xanthobacteraceae bacterium]|jgi:putative Mg2+ transporter-C (MgtC) family protein|nr:MgtC/SapB family protein [Xanthobacteraceae bacterium]